MGVQNMGDLERYERLAEAGASAEQIYLLAKTHNVKFDVLLRVLRLLAGVTLHDAEEQILLGEVSEVEE